jgi:hypothetical protein
MSWIGTVPYLLVAGNSNTVMVGNHDLLTTDFMGFVDGYIDSLIHFTTGYGTQGAGPTPVGIWHVWEATSASSPTPPAQSNYPTLVRPFMGTYNSETSSATPQTELSQLPSVCSTAMSNMVSNQSNQDGSRLFMWAPSLDLFDAHAPDCAPHANWILLQGENPLHNGGSANFAEEIQPRIMSSRTSNPAAKVMVQVSVTLGESNETILQALHTLDTNPPDGISIFAGGTTDNSVQARQLIELLRSS